MFRDSTVTPTHSTLSPTVHRLLAGAVAGMILLFGIALQMISPGSTDPLWLRAVLSGWFVGLFALSFHPIYRDWLPRLWIASVWTVTGWYLSITILNGFAPAYAVGTLMVLPAAGSVLRLVSDKAEMLQWFYVGTTTAVSVALPFSEMDPWSGVLYIGCVAGLLGIIYLTQENVRRKEQKLVKTKNFYEQVLEQLPVELAVFDPEARFVFLDPESVSDPELRQWLLGRTNEEYWEHHRGDRAIGRRRDEAIRRAAQTGEANTFEETLETEDGLRHYIRGHGPVKDPDGTVTHVAGYGLEITTRKEHERRLRRARQEAEAVFQHAQDAIFHVDVERSENNELTFRFLRINTHHEDLTGLTTGGVRGKTPRELLGPEAGREVAENYRRCMEAGEMIEYEEELPAPSGTKIWHTKLSPVLVDGTVVQIVGTAREISDRKRREEQLLLLDRMFQHDMRTDIGTALNWAELGQEGHNTTEALRHIRTATYHMFETLNAAGALQRALLHGEEMELRWVDIRPHVTEAAEIVQTRHPEATITYREEIGDAMVRGNDLLRSVFENLIANGVRHNDQPEPVVDVRITRRAGTVRVIVADNGPGIPSEQRVQIFGEGSQSLDSSGMGLGLYLVDRLVDQVGGHVEVTDNQPRGARFVVDLPCQTPTAPERRSEIPAAASP